MHAQIVPSMLSKRKASTCDTSLCWSSVEFLSEELAGFKLQSLEPNQYAAVHIANPLGVGCAHTVPIVLNL